MEPKLVSTSNSSSNRSRVEEDDDLEGLDDVLSSFNAPISTKPPLSPSPAHTASSAVRSETTSNSSPYRNVATTSSVADVPGNDDAFEASLVEGMESLLRSLAIDHPPGVMEGTNSIHSEKDISPSTSLSAEEEEKAFQFAIETMLSSAGIDALGQNSKPPPAKPSVGRDDDSVSGAPSFYDTISRTMESIKAGGSSSASSDKADMPAELASLLQQLQSDTSIFNELEDNDDELGGLLDGMMTQLMRKDVLEEPLTELASKYPAYLASPPKNVASIELERFRKQYKIVLRILDIFKLPSYRDETDGKEVSRLVGEMQDLGGPPNEIMGELPDGFELGGSRGDESCLIM